MKIQDRILEYMQKRKYVNSFRVPKNVWNFATWCLYIQFIVSIS